MKINEDLIKQTKKAYSCTNLPVVSGATHNIILIKSSNIVTFEIDALWVSSITKNTWIDVGYIDSLLKPPNDLSCPAIFTDANGQNIGYGRMMVLTTGKIRLKSNMDASTLTGANASMSWFI